MNRNELKKEIDSQIDAVYEAGYRCDNEIYNASKATIMDALDAAYLIPISNEDLPAGITPFGRARKRAELIMSEHGWEWSNDAQGFINYEGGFLPAVVRTLMIEATGNEH